MGAEIASTEESWPYRVFWLWNSVCPFFIFFAGSTSTAKPRADLWLEWRLRAGVFSLLRLASVKRLRLEDKGDATWTFVDPIVWSSLEVSNAPSSFSLELMPVKDPVDVLEYFEISVLTRINISDLGFPPMHQYPCGLCKTPRLLIVLGLISKLALFISRHLMSHNAFRLTKRILLHALGNRYWKVPFQPWVDRKEYSPYVRQLCFERDPNWRN